MRLGAVLGEEALPDLFQDVALEQTELAEERDVLRAS